MRNKQKIIILFLLGVLSLIVLPSRNKVLARAWVDTKGNVSLNDPSGTVVEVASGDHGVEDGNLTINSGVTLQLNSGATFHFWPGRSITVNGYITIAVHDGRKIVKDNWTMPVTCAGYQHNGYCWYADPIPKTVASNCAEICATHGGCAAGNWDDDCSVCQYFYQPYLTAHGGRTIICDAASSDSYAPYFYLNDNTGNIWRNCRRSPSVAPNCNITPRANTFTLLLCACNY